jgi:hypothetical protein
VGRVEGELVRPGAAVVLAGRAAGAHEPAGGPRLAVVVRRPGEEPGVVARSQRLLVQHQPFLILSVTSHAIEGGKSVLSGPLLKAIYRHRIQLLVTDSIIR